MARRRKDDDWIVLVAQLAGLVVLISLISPQMRQTLSAIGFVAFFSLGLVVVGLIGFGLYRLTTRSQGVERNADLALEVNQGVRPIGGKDPIQFHRVVAATSGKPQPQNTAPLIEQLHSIDWFQFEKLVALIYRKLGYTVTRRGGANPDGGIDLVIERGGQRSAVQCKHWKSWNVGVKAVREFLGALTDAGIERGIFVTLCGHTRQAKQLADKHGIEILNETGLADMIEATNARLDPETLAILRDTRKFCPKCECEMVLRTAKKGLGAGRQFWGCSAYPKCRFTMPVS